MGKFLLLILLVFVAYLLFKGVKRAGRAGGSAGSATRGPERMVVCAHCGVHLPESDSVRSGDKHYCSEEHRRLAG